MTLNLLDFEVFSLKNQIMKEITEMYVRNAHGDYKMPVPTFRGEKCSVKYYKIMRG